MSKPCAGHGLREDAARLEELFPPILKILFHNTAQDPLVHLSLAQLRMMRLLAIAPLMTSEVSADLGMTPSAVSQTASRLEKMGLVERLADAGDRRIRRLALTEQGRHLMQTRQSQRVDQVCSVLKTIPTDDRRELVDVLEKLLKALGPSARPSDPLALIAELEDSPPGGPQPSHEEEKTTI